MLYVCFPGTGKQCQTTNTNHYVNYHNFLLMNYLLLQPESNFRAELNN